MLNTYKYSHVQDYYIKPIYDFKLRTKQIKIVDMYAF